MKHTKRVLVHRPGYKPFYREQEVGSDKVQKYLKKAKLKKQEEAKTKAQKYLEKYNAKNKSKGLGAKSNDYVKEHSKPDYLGKININDETQINSKLNEFKEKRINSKIEHALVITKDGEVYECHGINNAVYPDVDLGDKINGAIISHNHPADETEYTFGQSDVQLLQQYKLKKLYGFDVEYSYEMELSNKPIIDDYDKVEEQYKYKNSRHNMLIYKLKQKGNISYRRTKNERVG